MLPSTEGHDEMVVTWLTFNATGTPIVEYGLEAFEYNMTASGFSTHFKNGNRDSYIHRVVLKQLKPTTDYCESTVYMLTMFTFA